MNNGKSLNPPPSGAPWSAHLKGGHPEPWGKCDSQFEERTDFSTGEKVKNHQLDLFKSCFEVIFCISTETQPLKAGKSSTCF